jgi:hypothetical protein
VQIFAVDFQHHVRPGQHQILVAAFQVRPSEILGGQIGLLQHSPHRAIHNQDAFTEQFAKGHAPLD